MNFSNFWACYGDQILTSIVALIGTVFTSVMAWVGAKINAKLDESERRKTIEDVIQSCVGLAERQNPKLTGSEKFKFAAEKASDFLASKGINISETEIELEIEKACNAFMSSYNKSCDDKIEEQTTSCDEEMASCDEEVLSEETV